VIVQDELKSKFISPPDLQRLIREALHEALTGETASLPIDDDAVPPEASVKVRTSPSPQPLTRFDLDHLYDD